MKKITTFLAICLLFPALSLQSQNEKQTVKEAERKHNQMMEKLHQLSRTKQMYATVAQLDKINKQIDKEIIWGTYDDVYKKAKLKDPSFSFHLRGDLPEQMNPAFWEDYEHRCDRIMANQKESINGIMAMVQLNNFDKVVAYGKQLKTTYDSFESLAENIGTSNYPKLVWDLYGNIKDFKENYANIQKAYAEGKRIDDFKADIRKMAEKARKSQELYNDYKRYLKSNRMVITDFQSNIRYINKLKGDADSGPVAKLSYADGQYNWNYGPFQKEAEELFKDFEEYESDCGKFKKDFEAIKKNARADWNKVKGNIVASDDKEKKDEFISYHNERWTEFLKIVTPGFNKAFNKYCVAEKTEKAEKAETAYVPADRPKEEIKEIRQTEQEIVTDNNDLFEGTKVNSGAVVAKIPETKKEPEKAKKHAYKSKLPNDKFWKKRIPRDATFEWIKFKHKLMLRYKYNGKTVGYRTFDYVLNTDYRSYWGYEEICDNLAIKHGPSRRFRFNETDGSLRLYDLVFWRANKETGPCLHVDIRNNNRSIKYYVDGKEISADEYKRALTKDPSLPPFDICEEEDWNNIDVVIPDEVKNHNNDNLSYSNLSIPGNAYKLINVYTTLLGLSYSEHYYLPNDFNNSIGARTWRYSANNVQLLSEVLKSGNKQLFRVWDDKGNLKSCKFYYAKNKIFKDDYKIVGPRIERYKVVTYFNHLGKKCTKGEYLTEMSKYHFLPSISIIESLKSKPDCKPNTHPDPVWANQDPTKIDLGKYSKVWRISKSPNYYEVLYYSSHSLFAKTLWAGKAFQTPLEKTAYSHSNVALISIIYTSNMDIYRLKIRGRLNSDDLSVSYNSKGELEYINFAGNDSKQKGFDEEFSNYKVFGIHFNRQSYLSPNLKIKPKKPQIPPTEITSLFKVVWNNQTMDYSVPDSFSDIEEAKNNQNTDESGKEPSYQQLQRQEFFALLPEVQKIIDKADKSFNKKYWNDPNSLRVTMNRTNPKQEALDILRTAKPLVKQAKYPENEAALDQLLAMKFTSYSGRVFGYEAKEAFFTEAAQLLVRSDQLIPQIKHFKTKEQLSDMYCISAEVWRKMTRKALWGDHPYNKMYCDKKVMQQYEKAVRTDPGNLKAKRILENLKAPKKPVPALVQKFEKIPDETWNKAQQEMIRLQQEETFKELNKEPEIHPLEVAEMTLEFLQGTVSIKRSGAAEWEKVTDSHVVLFGGDRIKTSDDAKGVSITYTSDQTFLAIKNSAEVEIVDENSLTIRRGDAFVQVRKKGNKFLVYTPTCAVGVRGTEFEINVKPDKTTETYLYKGVVETRTANDVGYLIPGQKMMAKKGTEKLKQTTFNPEKRRNTKWGQLERQKKQHRKLLATISAHTKKLPGNNKFMNAPSKPKNVKRTKPIASSHKPIIVYISSGPDRRYRPVLALQETSYGNNWLVARCPIKGNNSSSLIVKWYLNDQSNPISIGQYNLNARGTYFDGSIVSKQAPLNPGLYHVEFLLNNNIIGEGFTLIKAPKIVNQQLAQQVYVDALKKMQSALAFFYQGDIPNMKLKTMAAMTGLQQALYNNQSLPDVLSVNQTARALLALEKVDLAVRQSDAATAEIWLDISSAYANQAYTNCQDQQFKDSIQKIIMVIDQLSQK